MRTTTLAPVVLLAVFATACLATTIHVPSDESTVEAGIAAASPGDTVMIACDTYHENLLVVWSAITLMSETGDPSCVTLDGNASHPVLIVNHADGTVVSGITFANGYSMFGGGVAVDSCDVTFRDCVFTGNHATVEGGGLNYWHGTPEISGCDFFNNDAVYSGGGFTLNFTDGNVSDCTFSGNESQWGGGAAVYHTATTAFYDCMFIENNAPGEESYGGGFYTWNGAAPTLDLCAFVDNTSEYCGGGACSDDNCAAVFTNCSFSGNSAQYGGGLYVWEPSGGSVTDCTFMRNTAETGGGALLDAVDNMPLADCRFQDNVASVAGGGLGLEECGSGAGAVDCVFTGNTAMWGGAIGADFCTTTTLADGCTIVLNQTADAMGAGGGIAINAGAPTQIVRCIVAFGTLGGAVYCEDGGAVTADECVVFGNVGGDWVDCLSGQEAQNYNSDADPLFCDMLNDNFYLCENSYCLPSHNTPGVQIGVYTAGCDACGSPVEMKSWGGIKAMYR